MRYGVCMCLCIHTPVCVCDFMYIHVCIRLWFYVYTCVYGCTWDNALDVGEALRLMTDIWELSQPWMRCVHVMNEVCIRTYVCMYVWLYVNTYVLGCISINLWTWAKLSSLWQTYQALSPPWMRCVYVRMSLYNGHILTSPHILLCYIYIYIYIC